MSSYWFIGRQHIQTSTYISAATTHYKLSVVRTFLDRNRNIVTEEEDKKQEEHHVQTTLTRRGYPDWSIKKKIKRQMETIRQKKITRKLATQLAEENRTTVVIPYIHGLSEAVTRAYRRRGISSAMKPFQTIRSLLVHPKNKRRHQDACECVYKIPCKNCDKTYIEETGRAFGVRLQEHRQEVTQRDVRAYTLSISKSAATEQNKSAVTDHAISLNHIIDWDRAKVIDRESNRMNRWIREAIHIRKEQNKSMNRDEGSCQFPHIYDYLLFAAGGQSFRRRQQ